MGKIDSFHDQTRDTLPEEFMRRETDRRIRGDRLFVQFPVVATYEGNPIQGFIEAINISWSGMLLATNFPLNIGDFLEVEFTLPEREIPIKVRAKVIHKVKERFPEEATLIGIAFRNLDQRDKKIISGFVLESLPTE